MTRAQDGRQLLKIRARNACHAAQPVSNASVYPVAGNGGRQITQVLAARRSMRRSRAASAQES